MALDFALLDHRGQPESGIQIRLEPHFRLMTLIEESSLSLLQRLKDFYKDTNFSGGELEELLDEVGICLEKSSGDAELVKFLTDLQCLVAKAVRSGVGLAVIAD